LRIDQLSTREGIIIGGDPGALGVDAHADDRKPVFPSRGDNPFLHAGAIEKVLGFPLRLIGIGRANLQLLQREEDAGLAVESGGGD